MSNKYILEYCGVDKWHKAGYTGKKGLSATGEYFNQKDGLLDGVMITPFPQKYFNDNTGHAYQTAYIHHLFAPDRKIVSLPYTFPEFETLTMPYLKDNLDIDVFYLSMSNQRDGTRYDSFLHQLPHLSFFSAAGNYGEEKSNRILEAADIYGIGAIEVPACKQPSYTSVTDEVDFCGPTKMKVLFKNGASYTFIGTSCATPAIGGMAACVNDFFIEKTGKSLNKNQMYEFLKDCCKDIGVKGKDPLAGWGLPILPTPETVEVAKYMDNEKLFSDIQGHWAERFIIEAAADGIINGFPDGTFKPDEPLTRAQFCKIYCDMKQK